MENILTVLKLIFILQFPLVFSMEEFHIFYALLLWWFLVNSYLWLNVNSNYLTVNIQHTHICTLYLQGKIYYYKHQFALPKKNISRILFLHTKFKSRVCYYTTTENEIMLLLTVSNTKIFFLIILENALTVRRVGAALSVKWRLIYYGNTQTSLNRLCAKHN